MNTEESSIEKLWQAGLEMLVHQGKVWIILSVTYDTVILFSIDPSMNRPRKFCIYDDCTHKSRSAQPFS